MRIKLLSIILGLTVMGPSCQPIAVPFSVTEASSLPFLSTLASAFVRALDPALLNGRPRLAPLPEPQAVWTCEVVVIGGSLGGIAAASQSMKTGATTCLIELTPWLGGQVSAQGVSAIDESKAMRNRQNFAPSWQAFKRLIEQQPLDLPDWVPVDEDAQVKDINACWVGDLCFPPKAGAAAAQQFLEAAWAQSPESQWSVNTAFKGAEFDATGNQITAIYGVVRKPKSPDYVPLGRFSKELAQWYAWSANETFEKVPIRLEPPVGQQMIVIDATDTGELVGWANLPHRLGSEAKETHGERNGAIQDNPDCTQAFTYPFAIATHDDQNQSLDQLSQVKSSYAAAEHRQAFDMEGFPFFQGRSFFHYRRMVSSRARSNPSVGTPALGDITLVNWNRGNDWTWMNPSLILRADQLEQQRQNWLGGLSHIALGHAEDHALLFAQWLLEGKAQPPQMPLAYLSGAASPMGTQSGLSLVPYIRESRRILGRDAYGQDAFMMREQDLRNDQPGGRDFRATTVAVTHYDLDIHGCRYRNGEPSLEAGSAPTFENDVRPVHIPLESLIPQGVDNVLIGGKSIAVSHIANAVTRVHHGEWSIGAAAGTTAGWLSQTENEDLLPVDIVTDGKMPILQDYMTTQGLRLHW